MTSSVATVASGLLGLAAVGGLAALGTAYVRRPRPYLPSGLAVVGDGPADPLRVALRLGYAGLEVGVRLDGEVLRLTGAAFAGDPGATLDLRVLRPLAELVKPTVHGRVYPRRAESFKLLLRLERTVSTETAETAYRVLGDLLRQHASMLTRAVEGRVINAAVTVVLCGARWPRAALVDAYERYAFLEASFDEVAAGGLPVDVAPLITEPLTARIGWDPQEEWSEFPAEARHILRSLVLAAHADGRQVRFVDVPEAPRRVRQAFWRELHAAGVDHLASRHLYGLARFLRRSRFRSHKHRAGPVRYSLDRAPISR